MSALLQKKSNDRFQLEVEAVAAGTGLTKQEHAKIEEIEIRMEQFNQELYEAVDEELNQAGQDTKRVEALTNEIVKLKNQLDAFEERQEQAAKYRTELEWLMNELRNMDEFDPIKHRIAFRADIFERLVESGTIHPDGRIVYKFSTGIEWECYLEDKLSYKLRVKRPRRKKRT